jgi:hypothetical protein
LTYTTLNGLTYIIKLISFGGIVPVDEDYKEYWTCKHPSTDKPHDSRVPWFIRMARGHRHFWDPESEHEDFDAASHGHAVVADDESTDRGDQLFK